MLKGFSNHTSKDMKAQTLYTKLTSGDIELIGVSYESDYFPTGVSIIPYIEDIKFDDGSLSFTNKVNVVESLKPSIVAMSNSLNDSGLGFIDTQQLKKPLKETGLMTDLLGRGTDLTSTRKVDINTTFVDPTITYQDITICKDIKLRLYRIVDKSPLNGYTHIVYLLTTNKKYDGQTLVGMLDKEKELNKVDTLKVLSFFRNNSLINRSILSVKHDSDKYYYSLYNMNDTGIFFLEDDDKTTIACGQSYLKFNKSDVKSSKVLKVKDNVYTMEITMKDKSIISILM